MLPASRNPPYTRVRNSETSSHLGLESADGITFAFSAALFLIQALGLAGLLYAFEYRYGRAPIITRYPDSNSLVADRAAGIVLLVFIVVSMHLVNKLLPELIARHAAV